MNHYKFKFEAFDRGYDLRVRDVIVTVIALDEDEAMEKAKAIVKRGFYVLIEVTED